MWNSQVIEMLLEGIWDTVYMTLVSTALGYVFGLPMGILLAVTDADGIHPNAVCYIDFIIFNRRCNFLYKRLSKIHN